MIFSNFHAGSWVSVRFEHFFELLFSKALQPHVFAKYGLLMLQELSDCILKFRELLEAV